MLIGPNTDPTKVGEPGNQTGLSFFALTDGVWLQASQDVVNRDSIAYLAFLEEPSEANRAMVEGRILFQLLNTSRVG